MSDLEYPIKPTGYITRPQLWALDEACKPIREAFGSPWANEEGKR